MSGGFGIGAQVFVRDSVSGEASPWPDEPSGIIVRSGGSALAGVLGRAGGGRIWWVNFDEDQLGAGGHGVARSAQVHEKFLELAPPVSGAE